MKTIVLNSDGKKNCIIWTIVLNSDGKNLYSINDSFEHTIKNCIWTIVSDPDETERRGGGSDTRIIVSLRREEIGPGGFTYQTPGLSDTNSSYINIRIICIIFYTYKNIRYYICF